MNQFSNICGTYPVNNQILLFDGHDNYFNYGALIQMMYKNIQPFVIKSCESINDQPNYNGPNDKLKSLCNVEKSVWIMKYGTTKFSPHHMNFVLVEVWYAFKMSAGNIIKDSFAKTKLPPFSPTNLTTNFQAYAASIQVSYGSKAE